jgi:hypothetical protein
LSQRPILELWFDEQTHIGLLTKYHELFVAILFYLTLHHNTVYNIYKDRLEVLSVNLPRNTVLYMVHSFNLAAVDTLPSVLLLEEQSVDDADYGDDDDDKIDGERGHGLVAELHVPAAEAVYHVRHGLVVLDVLLVGVLEPGPELLQPPALGLLRQRPVVEPPGLLLAQHVVHLPEADELLRCHLERQRRRVWVVLLGQPPVRRLDLLDVRLRRYPQEPLIIYIKSC